MAAAQPLLLQIQNPLEHEVHLGQGFQTCQIGPDPSLSPFLLLATPEKNCHLRLLNIASTVLWSELDFFFLGGRVFGNHNIAGLVDTFKETSYFVTKLNFDENIELSFVRQIVVICLGG